MKTHPSPRRLGTAATALGSVRGDQSPCSRWPEPMEERTRGRKRRRRGGDFFWSYKKNGYRQHGKDIVRSALFLII
jgi:hypothetical protein